MYFRNTGWHFVGIPAGRSVSEEISNHKSSIHWLLTLDQKYNFQNFPYKELEDNSYNREDYNVNDNSWNRIDYFENRGDKEKGSYHYEENNISAEFTSLCFATYLFVEHLKKRIESTYNLEKMIKDVNIKLPSIEPTSFAVPKPSPRGVPG